VSEHRHRGRTTPRISVAAVQSRASASRPYNAAHQRRGRSVALGAPSPVASPQTMHCAQRTLHGTAAHACAPRGMHGAHAQLRGCCGCVRGEAGCLRNAPRAVGESGVMCGVHADCDTRGSAGRGAGPHEPRAADQDRHQRSAERGVHRPLEARAGAARAAGARLRGAGAARRRSVGLPTGVIHGAGPRWPRPPPLSTVRAGTFSPACAWLCSAAPQPHCACANTQHCACRTANRHVRSAPAPLPDSCHLRALQHSSCHESQGR
jgi:hypothetical protein